jgi:hypothetical protein
VTENPVEDGSTISDHIIIKPDVITCEGLVSDTPVTRIAGAVSPGQVQTKGNVQPGIGERRSQEAYDVMEDIFRQKLPVTIIDEFSYFDDMVLESWEAPRTGDRGSGGLDFTATFKKIITVETLTEALPPDVVSALKRRRAKTKTKRDNVNPELVKYLAQKQKVVEQGKKSKTPASPDEIAAAGGPATTWTSAYGRTK